MSVVINSTTKRKALASPGSEAGTFDHIDPPVVLTIKHKRIQLALTVVIFGELYFAGLLANHYGPGGNRTGSIALVPGQHEEGSDSPDTAIASALSKVLPSIGANKNLEDPKELLGVVNEAKSQFQAQYKDKGIDLIFPSNPEVVKPVVSSNREKIIAAMKGGDEAQAEEAQAEETVVAEKKPVRKKPVRKAAPKKKEDD